MARREVSMHFKEIWHGLDGIGRRGRERKIKSREQ
jgi:hypothetical protein